MLHLNVEDLKNVPETNSSTDHNLYIGHVNIRSLVPCFPDVCDLLQQQKFHIFGITESWLTQEYPDNLVNIPGYKLFRADRASRGGGICLYVSDCLQSLAVSISEVLISDSLEQLWVEVKYRNKTLLIGTLYKPPLVFYQSLSSVENVLSSLYATYNHVILMGDLNINFLSNSVEYKYLQSLLQVFSLKQIITDPTRVSRNSSTLIDIICVNDNIDVLNSGTMGMLNMTDHRLIYSLVSIVAPKLVKKTITYRDFKHFNKLEFEQDLQHINYDVIMQQESVNSMVLVLNEQLTDIFDRHAPLKSAVIKHKYKPYITDTIREIIKLKEKAFKKFRRTGLVEHKSFYLDIKNYLSFAIRSEKQAYMNFELSKHKKNTKKLWSDVSNWNIHSKTNSELPEHLKNVNQISQAFASVSQLAVAVDISLFSSSSVVVVEREISLFSSSSVVVVERESQIV